MSRLFHVLVAGVCALLAAAFVLLLVSLVAELWRATGVRPPRGEEILFAVELSILTATVSSLLALFVATPVAYVLARYRFRGKALLDTLLDLPIVLSPIALGALLLVFFKTPLGKLIDGWFGPFVFEVRGIVLAQFFVVVGLAVRLLKAAFDGVDPDYEDLARTLGYDRVRVFFRVVLPMARRGVVAALLLVWGRAIGEFGATVTLAGATTMKTETLPVAIYLNFESADISTAMLFIGLLVAISFAVLLFVRKVQPDAQPDAR